MKIISPQKGLSVVELVVYIGILGLITIVLFNSLTSITRAYATLKSARAIHASALTSYERLAYEIRGAKRVELGSSVFSTNPGTLALVRGTDLGESTTIFSLTDGILKISVDGVDQGGLSKENATISSLIFRYFTSAGSEAVSVEMVIESTHGTSTRSAAFYDTFKLRGSY